MAISRSQLLKELLPELKKIGFDIEVFGSNSFIVRGLPSASSNEEAKTLIEGVLVGFESNIANPSIDQHQALASALAFKASIKTGKKLQNEEMHDLINKLFRSNNPETLPNGKRILKRIDFDEIENYFN